MNILILDTIGFVAAILTTFAFLPQLLHTVKTKNTTDLSLRTFILFSLGILLWGIYGYCKQDYPIIFANVISFVFCVTILIYKLKYK